MTETMTNCINTIVHMIDQYKDNEYMLQRIHNHININLPNTLNNENINYQKRVFLTTEQQIFIQVFLSKNKFYYLSNNNSFYEYDGEKYLIVKEDDVIHKLLSTISNDRILMKWKYKTKINIIKQIKDRSLFSSIPETNTIQNVLNVLYPLIFTSKNFAKYFLTIIGDNILKKPSSNIYLVSNKFKKILNELDNVANLSIGNNNTTNNFMTKYHENHSYENCRLLKINENFSEQLWRELLKKVGLDLLCVSVHYSKRYENSDKFIDNKYDEELITYTYFLKKSNHDSIVDDFCNKYIINTHRDNKIEWKNLHFVWKQFLSDYNLLNIIYSNKLKNIIKERYEYDETADSFYGITSKYLPTHSEFIKFVETTITYDVNLFQYELEIDELCYLFKLWTKQNSVQHIHISEENILQILKHFFPTFEIIEDKYVLNISSCLWDKISDINNSFNFIKENIKSNDKNSLISFDDAYNYYYKYCNIKSFKLIVSKRYFEKYLCYKLSNIIVYEKFMEVGTFLDY